MSSAMSLSPVSRCRAPARSWIAVGPVDQMVANEFGVGNYDRDPIVGGHHRGAQVYALHIALLTADADAIADAHGTLEEQDEPGRYICRDVLQTEAHAHR